MPILSDGTLQTSSPATRRMTETSPFFASSREALSFAANHSEGSYQSPVMSRMMNEVARANAEQQAVASRQRVPVFQGFSQMDRAGQAAFILQIAGRLPDEMIHALLCAVLRPRTPCNCRSSCCRGWRSNGDWVESLRVVDRLIVAEQAKAKPDKKKGFITPDGLRVQLMRQFFDHDERLTQTTLAAKLGISEQTVAMHQRAIAKLLVGLIRSGFTQLDALFIEAGIVGAVS